MGFPNYNNNQAQTQSMVFKPGVRPQPGAQPQPMQQGAQPTQPFNPGQRPINDLMYRYPQGQQPNQAAAIAGPVRQWQPPQGGVQGLLSAPPQRSSTRSPGIDMNGNRINYRKR